MRLQRLLLVLAGAPMLAGCSGPSKPIEAKNKSAPAHSKPLEASRPPSPSASLSPIPEFVPAPTSPRPPSPYAEGPLEPLSEPAPNLIELDLPGGAGTVNPSEEEHKLALIEEDEWNRALACPGESRAEKQPPGEDLHRCAYRWTNTIVLSNISIWLGAARFSHEHDGMYGYDDEIAIMVPHKAGIRVIHTLTQWSQDVVDCYSSLLYRRGRAVDLNGDGAMELCIESVSERGLGLFEVMDMEKAKQKWRPLERTRRIEAFRMNPMRFKIERAKDLDKACPKQGYSLFVKTPLYPDALAYRRDLQGDPARAPCPTGPPKTCLGLTDICPASPR